jgi:hypothetical protein
MGRRKTGICFCWENEKEIDNWENQDLSGWSIFRRTLERYDGVVWARLVWLRIETGEELL